MDKDEALKAKLIKEAERYNGDTLPTDTELYKLISQCAAEVGIPLKDINVEITSGLTAQIAYEEKSFAMFRKEKIAKTLTVGADLIEYLPVAGLRGMLKHEMQHEHQNIHNPKQVEQRDKQLESQEAFLKTGKIKKGDYPASRILEADADFASGKDQLETIKDLLIVSPPAYNVTLDHPSIRNRLKMALIRNDIEEQGGFSLKPEDVNIKENADFTIKGIDTPEGRKKLATTLADRKFSGDAHKDKKSYDMTVGHYADALAKLQNGGMHAVQKKADAALSRVDGVVPLLIKLDAPTLEWLPAEEHLINNAISPKHHAAVPPQLHGSPKIKR